MLGVFRRRNRLNSVTAHPAVVGWVLLALSSCGDNSTPTPGGLDPDAARTQTAKPLPADASLLADAAVLADAAAPSVSSATNTAASHSGTAPIPTTPSVMTTGLPSAIASQSAAPTATSAASTWVEVESPLEGQSNCREQMTGMGSRRAYRLECEPDKLWVSCSLAAEDAVECYCVNETTGESHVYTLQSGTELETAARDGIAICNGSNAPAFSEPDCEATSSAYSYSCIWQEVCTQTAELAGGLQATEQTLPYRIDCYGQSDEQSWCTCPDTGLQVLIGGVDTAGACAAAVPVCREEVEPEEAITCTAPSLYSSSYTCSSSQTCGRRANLGDADQAYTLVAPLGYYGSLCDWVDEDTVNCSCSSPIHVSLSGMLDASLNDACLVMDEICNSPLPLEASGALVCGSHVANAAGGSCTASASCEQAIGDGSATLLARGQMYSDCEPDANGGWSCVCNGGGPDSQPESITAPNALRACLNAIDSCAARGRVEFDDNGYTLIELSDPPSAADAGAPAADASVSGN
jgi:hypothetical protein